jgi:hypothetical protein
MLGSEGPLELDRLVVTLVGERSADEAGAHQRRGPEEHREDRHPRSFSRTPDQAHASLCATVAPMPLIAIRVPRPSESIS